MRLKRRRRIGFAQRVLIRPETNLKDILIGLARIDEFQHASPPPHTPQMPGQAGGAQGKPALPNKRDCVPFVQSTTNSLNDKLLLQMRVFGHPNPKFRGAGRNAEYSK